MLLLQRILKGKFNENIFLDDDKLGLLHDPLDYSMLPDLREKVSKNVLKNSSIFFIFRSSLGSCWTAVCCYYVDVTKILSRECILTGLMPFRSVSYF